MKQVFGLFVVVVLCGTLIFIMFTVISTKNSNEDLKKELYETKIELSNIKQQKTEIQQKYDSLFQSYIELGLGCGANE